MNINITMLDLYSDYLISSFGATTATGLSALTDGLVSHDRVSRFLNDKPLGSKELWITVKPVIRMIESDDGALILDDTIVEKLYTDENDIIAWHFDHALKRHVKGVNILSCLYASALHEEQLVPISFQPIAKTKEVTTKEGKKKRVSEKTKNEYARDMLGVAVKDNKIRFRYVLADIWFGSSDNMRYIKKDLKKDFIIPVKENRLIALSREDKEQEKYVSITSLQLEHNQPREIYLKGVEFPVLIHKQIFTNKDGSTGILYLTSSDLMMTADEMERIYHTRWKVERYHESLKSNLSLSKSPTKTVKTQTNHFFASIYAFVKLETLRIQAKTNHFALKSQLYISALKASFAQLQQLKLQVNCVT